MSAVVPRLERLDARAFDEHAARIMAIEAASYEAGRTDPAATLRALAGNPRGVCHAAFSGATLVGFSFAGPLEGFAHVGGVADDPELGSGSTLYAADLTVSLAARGAGVGRALKTAQLRAARALGYRYVSGRVRAGLAAPMWRLARALGAVEVARVADAYPDGPEPREAIYYRMDLR